jgi:hypothetical protein
MKWYHTLLLICLLSLSCNKKVKPERPNNLIPREQMINILYDLYIINGAKNVNRTQMDEKGVEADNYVFTKYDIDSLQFAKSNAYYAYDPDDYKDMVEEVRDRLEIEKENIQELQRTERERRKRRQDSIRNSIIKKAEQSDSSSVKLKPKRKPKPKVKN